MCVVTKSWLLFF